MTTVKIDSKMKTKAENLSTAINSGISKNENIFVSPSKSSKSLFRGKTLEEKIKWGAKKLKTAATDLLYEVDYGLGVFFEAVDGKFGKRVLKRKYRRVWRAVTYTTLIICFFKYIMFPIIDWWSGVVHFLNYVIWG